MIAIDGSTGRVSARVPLPREVVASESANDGMVLSPTVTCRSARIERGPTTVGPIVGADGLRYLVVRQRVQVARDGCLEQELVPREQDIGLTLIRLSPTGVAATEVLLAQHCSAARFQRTLCDAPPQPDQLLPDVLDGMLVTAVYTTSISGQLYLGEKRVTRFDAATGRADYPVPWDLSILLTGDAGTAYVGTGGAVHAVDTTVWTSKWTTSAGVPLMALDGGGVALQAGTTGPLTELDMSGTVVQATPLGLGAAVQVRFGLWSGIDSSGPTPYLAGARRPGSSTATTARSRSK